MDFIFAAASSLTYEKIESASKLITSSKTECKSQLASLISCVIYIIIIILPVHAILNYQHSAQQLFLCLNSVKENERSDRILH